MTGLKNSIKRALYYSGYYSLLHGRGVADGPRLLILMYHDIIPDHTPREPLFGENRLKASQFAAHLKQLTQLYRVLTLEDAIDEMADRGTLTESTAAITFDDGYESFHDIAYPVLKSHGVSATVYLPTDWISGRLRPWWLLLEQVLRMVHDKGISISQLLTELQLDRLAEKYHRRPHEDWQRFKGQVEGDLRSRPDGGIDTILQKIAGVAGSNISDVAIDTKAMSWEQIAKLCNEGIRFGAHTQSHCNLRYVSDELTRKELVRSKEIIEEQTSKPVTGFAYPYGVDEDRYAQIIGILKKSQFSHAVTANPGINNSSSNRYMLKRTTLPHTTSTAILFRQLVLDYRQPLG